MQKQLPTFIRFIVAVLVILSTSLGCAREAKEPAKPQAVAEQPAAEAPAAEAPAGDAQAKFERYVAERNSCAADAECVLVSPGCPLGCGTGVRPEHAEEVSKKAASLIAETEQGGGGCTYKCASLVPKCQEGRCTAVQE